MPFSRSFGEVVGRAHDVDAISSVRSTKRWLSLVLFQVDGMLRLRGYVLDLALW